MKKILQILLLILSVPVFLNGQNKTVIVAGDTMAVDGYNSNNQDSTIKYNDTIIVVGDNPQYYFKNRFNKWELKYKLPKGTYKFYWLKGKYWNKVKTIGYENMEEEILNNKKYRGYLNQITTFGEDSLRTVVKYFTINPKTSKSVFTGVQHYSNGVLHGIATEYYNDSKIWSVGTYKEGRKHGTWYYFSNEDSTDITEHTYNMGKLVED